MRLSKKTDYSFRVLFTLVEHSGERPLSIRELAEINDIPRRFLEHIMLDLKQNGWVKSVAGRFGGYTLGKKPEEITMGQVVRYFDGILAPIGCVSVFKHEYCSQQERCRFRGLLLNLRDWTANIMDNASLAAVCSGNPPRNNAYEFGLTEGAGI